ncbi:MAG TPA: hypothetical protein VME42_07485 [Steroidobacteraceae bacterium]|nr:hypothetical protein [Steroidobacteraceae bacterium]
MEDDSNLDLLHRRPKSGRFAGANITDGLGLLAELAGSWEGTGFNLIARPPFHYTTAEFLKANPNPNPPNAPYVTDLYLQLNQTRETLKFDAIGSPIPNRGFKQDDIQLFGLTYLQKIRDQGRDGALHIEPGIWITQPATTFPVEPDPPKGQIVGRMGSIPHGNALLAQGAAQPFSGPPVLAGGGVPYNGSLFPSFNSTPFGVPPTAPGIVFSAPGSSERITGAIPVPPATVPPVPFPPYDFTVPPGPITPGLAFGGLIYNPPFTLNTRTPYDTNPVEPALPAAINGVGMQTIINDPITLLQQTISQQVAEGYTFEGTALNIATTTPLTFLQNPNTGGAGPKLPPVAVPQFGGGIENIQFLNGVAAPPPPAPPGIEENAQTAVVYATFWIERVTHEKSGHSFMQLQYAQMVVLNFPIFHLLPKTYVNLGWPHISVATLVKHFG